MCEQCGVIDVKIKRYRWLQNQIQDKGVLNALAEQIDRLDARKMLLHPPASPLE